VEQLRKLVSQVRKGRPVRRLKQKMIPTAERAHQTRGTIKTMRTTARSLSGGRTSKMWEEKRFTTSLGIRWKHKQIPSRQRVGSNEKNWCHSTTKIFYVNFAVPSQKGYSIETMQTVKPKEQIPRQRLHSSLNMFITVQRCNVKGYCYRKVRSNFKQFQSSNYQPTIFRGK